MRAVRNLWSRVASWFKRHEGNPPDGGGWGTPTDRGGRGPYSGPMA